jgi:hypothetical protein
MSNAIEAFLLTMVEVYGMTAAFYLFKNGRTFWAWAVALIIPMGLSYADGHYFWGHHTLLAFWDWPPH